jgi:hypothetical protein
METIFDAPPQSVQEDLDALNKALDGQIPSKNPTKPCYRFWFAA